jgi:pyruvate/2-oxoglutarate dehydrogenase complex dihydrolipoamide acyltransferase (E2) component
MTNLCLSWDHRALDGALAAQFLATVRERIERWESA